MIVVRRGASLLLLVACGEWESTGTWEAPRACSLFPSCEAGLRLEVTRSDPLRDGSFDVELVTDVARHASACTDAGCVQEIPEDDVTELGAVVRTNDGFDVWLTRLAEPPLATGPDEVRVRVSQGEGILFDAAVVPEYEIVDEDRCHVCELAEVELTLD
jgi:hypothetical protein